MIVASFQAKIGWNSPTKREEKFSFRSIPTHRVTQNSKKNSKKIYKTKKIQL